MRQTRINRRKGKSAFAAVLLAAVLASGSYALTAANTVPASKAGDGEGAVSGYTASAIHYNLNATDPGTADSVQFNLDEAPAAGGTVKVQVVDGGDWHSCTNLLVAVTCSFGLTGEPVADIDQLRVVAAQ
jgi:hypothetical protein